MNLCVDCRHYRFNSLQCQHPNAMRISPVDGKEVPIAYPGLLRLQDEYCGIEGKWFEQVSTGKGKKKGEEGEMKNDGGPAFPLRGVSEGELQSDRRYGMTLRDWFAGQTMSAIITGDANSSYEQIGNSGKEISAAAYAVADAMLAAREEKA